MKYENKNAQKMCIIDFNQDEIQESVLITYRDIQWKHLSANTNGYSSWLTALDNE